MDPVFAQRYPIHSVGANVHAELWIGLTDDHPGRQAVLKSGYVRPPPVW
jgi:hypothetical protein